MEGWTPLNSDNIANGLWVVVTLLLSALGVRVGYNRGTTPPPETPPAKPLEVVGGALIDAKALGLLTDGLGIATAGLVEHKRKIDDLVRAVERLNELVADLDRGLADLHAIEEKNARNGSEIIDMSGRLARDLQDLRGAILALLNGLNQMPRQR